MDPRLGSGHSVRCATCHENSTKCPGHNGYIDLLEPIYFKEAMPLATKILQCVCHNCARVRVDVEFDTTGEERLREIHGLLTKKKENLLSITNCSHCGASLYKFFHKGDDVFVVDGVTRQFSAGEAYNIFLRIGNEDLKLLGFNNNLPKDPKYTDKRYLLPRMDHILQFRPEALICDALPVTRSTIRPSTFSNGDINQDDITEKLNSIIRKIDTQRKSFDDPKKKAPKTPYSISIRDEVWCMLNNSKGGNTNSRPSRGIYDRMEKKKGTIQSNAMGKRSNYSTRGTITAAGLETKKDYLGVPEKTMRTLTRPILITENNIEYMQRFLDDGFVNRVDNNGRVKNLDGRGFTVNPGDIIHRQLLDGDRMIWNRQPTLHQASYTSVRVFRVDGNAYKLVLAYTAGYNADFDGDEMNGHQPQDHQSWAEMNILLRSALHIVTPQNGTPVNGLVQDALTACYMLTHDDFDVTVPLGLVMDNIFGSGIEDAELQNFLKRAKRVYPDFIKKRRGVYSIKKDIPGKLYISLALPEKFDYKHHGVIINNGIVQPNSGPLSKNTVGSRSNSIVHILWQMCPDEVVWFLSKAQNLTDRWLYTHGFTFGIADCLNNVQDDIDKINVELKDEIDDILDDFEEGSEDKVIRLVETAMTRCIKLVETGMNKGPKNALNVLMNAGTKGNKNNQLAITGFVGQQFIDGGRVKKEMSNSKRTLSYFDEDDEGLDSRGFIDRPYLKGLTPSQVFYHAISGREGINKTVAATPRSGYKFKQLCRKMDDLSIWFDGTVRSCHGGIISFMYGDHGLDPKYLNRGKSFESSFLCHLPYHIQRLNYEGEEDLIDLDDYLDYLMEYIHGGIVGFPTENAEENTKFLHASIGRVLAGVKVKRDVLVDAFVLVRDIVNCSKIAEGVAVGLISACSMGQPITQLVLNAFHFSGQNTNTRSKGIKRFEELTEGTKTKSLKHTTVFVYPEGDMNLNGVEFKLLVDDWDIYYKDVDIDEEGCPFGQWDVYPYEDVWWSTAYKKMANIEPMDSWMIKVHLNTDILKKYRIETWEVAEALEKEGLIVVPGPTLSGIIELFPQWNDLTHDLTIGGMVTENNLNFHVCQKWLMPSLSDVLISGVRGLIDAVHVKDDDNDDVIECAVTITKHSDLVTTMKDILGRSDVDSRRSYIDNIWVTRDLFGVEALRSLLIEEIHRVFVVDGISVHKCHIQLLVDSMLCTGDYTSVQCSGIDDREGPVKKFTFERTLPNLNAACSFGGIDKLESNSAGIFYGNIPNIGTGRIEVTTIGPDDCIDITGIDVCDIDMEDVD